MVRHKTGIALCVLKFLREVKQSKNESKESNNLFLLCFQMLLCLKEKGLL